MLPIDQSLIKSSVWLNAYLVLYVALDIPAVVSNHYTNVHNLKQQQY